MTVRHDAVSVNAIFVQRETNWIWAFARRIHGEHDHRRQQWALSGQSIRTAMLYQHYHHHKVAVAIIMYRQHMMRTKSVYHLHHPVNIFVVLLFFSWLSSFLYIFHSFECYQISFEWISLVWKKKWERNINVAMNSRQIVCQYRWASFVFVCADFEVRSNENSCLIIKKREERNSIIIL